MSKLILPAANGKFKIPAEQAANAAMQAIREHADVTDVLIVTVNRRTGGFKTTFWPPEPNRVYEVARRAFERVQEVLKRPWPGAGGTA